MRGQGATATAEALLFAAEGAASVEKCRYAYAEFYMFPLEEPGGFGALVEQALGGAACWIGCWESEEGLGQEHWTVAGRRGRRRKLLIRLKEAQSVAQAQWTACLGRELTSEVAALESVSFREGHAGKFVQQCKEAVARGGALGGFVQQGAVECAQADLRIVEEQVYNE